MQSQPPVDFTDEIILGRLLVLGELGVEDFFAWHESSTEQIPYRNIALIARNPWPEDKHL